MLLTAGKLLCLHMIFFSFLFAVSASGKQKYYDIDVADPDTLTSTSVEGSVVDSHQYRSERFDERFIGRNASLDGDNMSMHSLSTTRSDKFLPTASICTSASTSTATTHIKRYKMERKNSQQSQHGKQEPSTVGDPKFNIQSEMSELFNDIQVKIADLGNACYDVSIMKISAIECDAMHRIYVVSVFTHRIIISLKIFRRGNIVRLKCCWAHHTITQLTYGAPLVWPLNY